MGLLEIGAVKCSRITFYSQPIGMHFIKGSQPLRVNGFAEYSQAKAKGVQEGWILKTVESEDMTNVSYDDAIEQMKMFVANLPREVLDTKGKGFKVGQTIKFGKGGCSWADFVVTEAEEKITYSKDGKSESFAQESVNEMEIETTQDAEE